MCRILQKEGSVKVIKGPHNFQPFRVTVGDDNGTCSHQRRIELCPQCRTIKDPRDKAYVDGLYREQSRSGVAFSMVRV